MVERQNKFLHAARDGSTEIVSTKSLSSWQSKLELKSPVTTCFWVSKTKIFEGKCQNKNKMLMLWRHLEFIYKQFFVDLFVKSYIFFLKTSLSCFSKRCPFKWLFSSRINWCNFCEKIKLLITPHCIVPNYRDFFISGICSNRVQHNLKLRYHREL